MIRESNEEIKELGKYRKNLSSVCIGAAGWWLLMRPIKAGVTQPFVSDYIPRSDPLHFHYKWMSSQAQPYLPAWENENSSL